MNFSNPPTPHIKRVMLFIDGKNLAERFKEVQGSKKIDVALAKSLKQKSDYFLWREGNIRFPTIPCNLFEIVRANYYTVCKKTGVEVLSELIRNTRVKCSDQFFLYPVIISFNSRDRNPKGDDIKLCIDALHHASNSNADIFYLFTGDGDFVPLVEEIQRMGKLVFLAAFSSGLNPNLKEKADYFFDLDPIYGLK